MGGVAALRPDRAAAGEGAPEPKAYDKVITKDVKSTPGLFTVHRLKEKVSYEIPKKELGKDMLWVTQIAKTTLGAGYGLDRILGEGFDAVLVALSRPSNS